VRITLLKKADFNFDGNVKQEAENFYLTLKGDRLGQGFDWILVCASVKDQRLAILQSKSNKI
jgi:hypothetical protein